MESGTFPALAVAWTLQWILSFLQVTAAMTSVTTDPGKLSNMFPEDQALEIRWPRAQVKDGSHLKKTVFQANLCSSLGLAFATTMTEADPGHSVTLDFLCKSLFKMKCQSRTAKVTETALHILLGLLG